MHEFEVRNVHFMHLFRLSRAMAMCFALMFGRLGSVAGSSLTAILLEKRCQSAFYTAGFSLIGKHIGTTPHKCATYFIYDTIFIHSVLIQLISE